MGLFEDLTSGDPQRIWSASCAVRTSRNMAELEALAGRIEEIRAKTKGVALGGAFRPNASHLAFAIRKLQFVRDSGGCLCELYPEDEMFNPEAERDSGNVRILETLVDEARQTVTHRCRCVACGQSYRVEERQYHYTWWAWTRA
ncbi:MAG: hypothetical protein AB1921_05875 [Thermodesulfobacteriota bacterium]